MTGLIEIEGLRRSFDRKLALDGVDLAIPAGVVLGLVGPNGAGKTTLIRHVLGLLRAQQGAVRVFGFDPVTHPAAVLGRLGYVSEDRDLPQWMRVSELLSYTAAFYPRWDQALAEDLCAGFEIDQSQRIGALSRGQHVRCALVLALAHRPELLVLDEPSSGLDPVVRRDVLEAILRTVAQEGRTVLFSSHLLGEVERMSDRLALIDHGRIKLHGSLESLREQHTLLSFRLQQPAPCDLPQILEHRCADGEHHFLVRGGTSTVESQLVARGGVLRESCPATLEQIFHAHIGRHD